MTRRVTQGVPPAELIRRKRDGALLAEAEITAFVAGIADGSVSESQVAAPAMAVYFRGMPRADCAALTRAMMRSGTVLDWSSSDLGGPILDKHSTGGIGDKVSRGEGPRPGHDSESAGGGGRAHPEAGAGGAAEGLLRSRPAWIRAVLAAGAARGAVWGGGPDADSGQAG